MRWPKDQSWLWRWSAVLSRHSVPPLRAARAPAVHRPASERRPGPRDLEYEAMGGPSSPGQRRILLQLEAPISPHPKEFDTANACNSTERAGLPEIVGC